MSCKWTPPRIELVQREQPDPLWLKVARVALVVAILVGVTAIVVVSLRRYP